MKVILTFSIKLDLDEIINNFLTNSTQRLKGFALDCWMEKLK